MQISETGLALIRRFEGFAPAPYRCPAGYWTIGYGHMLADHPDPRRAISRDKAEQLLVQDVRISESAVTALITVSLRQHQFDALVSFTFNLGSGALQRSTLRRRVNAQAHAEVPEQFLRWIYAGGRALPGLLRRRHAEAALYAAGTS